MISKSLVCFLPEKAEGLRQRRTPHLSPNYVGWHKERDVHDIDIHKLDYEFITELEFWYKSVRHIDHNTTMKYIACIKKKTIRTLLNGWLQRDPFIGFNLALREVEREALTAEELQTMSCKNFGTERLNQGHVFKTELEFFIVAFFCLDLALT
jgi:Phage integrase SAM-like domain